MIRRLLVTAAAMAGPVVIALSLTSAVKAGNTQPTRQSAAPGQRPNILWITSEDNGPHSAPTATSTRRHRTSTSWQRGGFGTARPGRTRRCAAPPEPPSSPASIPSRTGASTCEAWCVCPTDMKMYPALLHEAGYYSTNNSKDDYNFAEARRRCGTSRRRPRTGRTASRASRSSPSSTSVSRTRVQIRRRPHKLGPRHRQGARCPPYHARHPGDARKTGHSTTTSSPRWTAWSASVSRNWRPPAWPTTRSYCSSAITAPGCRGSKRLPLQLGTAGSADRLHPAEVPGSRTAGG